MIELGPRWKQGVAVLAVLALGYQAWRSRWLWGLSEAGKGPGAARVGQAAAVGPAASAAVVGPAAERLGADLDRFLARLAAYGWSGSALVARGGRVLLDKGYGLADRERRRPYTAETIFDVASISKQFTAAAILRLEMEGKLKVEDPLGKFFPEAPADKAAITLHQLLTHTSGLRDTFGEEYDPVGRRQLLRRVFASRLLGPPGRRYRYSNGGYSVLAAVVEVASGQPYGDYLRGRLFAPAGMLHTGFHLPAEALPLVAHGYTARGDWGTPLDHPWAPDGPYWNLRGNGGILTSTGDLYRWHLALAGDRVLAAPQRQKYVTPYVSEGRWAHTSYAYGWSIGKSPTGKREISHIGGNEAFESDFRRYVDDGAVIVLSGNSVDVSALALGDHLENRLYGLSDPDPPPVAPPPVDPAVAGAAAAARCAGVYLLPAGRERLRVTVDAAPAAPAGRLEIAAEGPRGLQLLLGALREDDRGMVAERDEQVGAALAAARQRDLAPFAKVMGLELDAATALLDTNLAGPLRQLGPWTGAAVLGGAARGGRWFTYARLVFARGARIAEVGWAGPTAETLRLLDAVPGQRFLPVGPAAFAAFDVRTGATVRAGCELPAGGAVGGPAAALTLGGGPSGAAGAVRAARAP